MPLTPREHQALRALAPIREVYGKPGFPMSAEQGNVEAIRKAIIAQVIYGDERREALAALDRLAAALERAERERDALQEWTDRVSAESARAATAAEKAERALAEIVKFEGAVEGDESDQADALVEVSRIARSALRPSEDTSDPFSGEPGTSSSAGGSWGNYAGDTSDES